MSVFNIPFADITVHSISFSYENLNILLIIIAVALILHFLVIWRSRKRAIKFSNYETLTKLVGKDVVEERNVLPLLLRTAVLAMLVFSISNFQIQIEGFNTQTDFFIAMDTSASMLNPDVPPTRLDAAKQSAVSLIEKLPSGANAGVIAFGGTSRVVSPLTSDHSSTAKRIPNITFSTEAGTAIGDALVLGATELQKQNRTEGAAIMLITDGQNNVGVSINESIRYVRSRNLTIYTIGIGAAANGTNATFSVPEEFQRDDATVTVSQDAGYDPASLRRLANETGGGFYTAETQDQLSQLYGDVVLEEKVVELDITIYLLMLAVALLLLEWGLGATKYKTLP